LAITYVPTTNFGAKDSLPTNDPAKVIKGSEFSTEFVAIQTAFGLAAPAASPTFTGTVTIASVDINGGTIDGATIATSDVTVGAGKTLDVSAGTLTLANDQISGDKIEGGTIGSVTITTADINGGTLDGVTIGGASAGAGTFTTLNATGGGALTGTWTDLGSVTTVDINGGTLDGVTIGGSSAGAITGTTGQFNTSLNVDGTVTADGLTVDGDGTLQTSDGAILTLKSTDTTLASTEVVGSIQFNTADSSDAGVASKIEANAENASGEVGLNFHTGKASALIKRVNISRDGDISFYEDTGTTPKFFWDASAEALGIGTSSPSAPLNISATYSSDTTEQFRVQDNTGGKLDFFGYANGGKGIQAYADDGSTFYNLNLQPLGGNVGIGTSSPAEKLEVFGTTGMRANAGGYLLKFLNSSSTSELSGFIYDNNQDNIEFTAYDSSYALTFKTANTERMRIDTSGNVGLGSNAISSYTNYKTLTIDHDTTGSILQLNGATSGHYHLVQNNNGSMIISADQGNAVGSTTINFLTDGTERARIDSSGNLLVGKTVTGQVLTNGIELKPGNASYISACGDQAANPPLYLANKAASGTRNLAYFYGTSTLVGSITHNGTNTAYNTSSDARLKENIADAEDAGAKVDAIQVRQFDWKEGGAHQDYGMIAQELMNVAPEAVSGDPESDEMMGVDYSKLVPMMLKEIQSLRARVHALEGK
jgi:hypothetical protein